MTHAVIETELKSEFGSIWMHLITPPNELWGLVEDVFEGNWLRYNVTYYHVPYLWSGWAWDQSSPWRCDSRWIRAYSLCHNPSGCGWVTAVHLEVVSSAALCIRHSHRKLQDKGCELETQDIYRALWLLVASSYLTVLTHWGRATHTCVGKLTIIGSDNGLSPGRRQAITWTNAGIVLIGPLGTNFSEILIEIQAFS